MHDMDINVGVGVEAEAEVNYGQVRKDVAEHFGISPKDVTAAQVAEYQEAQA